MVLKQAFDVSEPHKLSLWWHDDRKKVQWYTFWIAALVLILTIVFGLIQSAAAVVQAWVLVKALGNSWMADKRTRRDVQALSNYSFNWLPFLMLTHVDGQHLLQCLQARWWSISHRPQLKPSNGALLFNTLHSSLQVSPIQQIVLSVALRSRDSRGTANPSCYMEYS